MTNVINELAAANKRDDVPAFRAGDNIKVHVKVVEDVVLGGYVVAVSGRHAQSLTSDWSASGLRPRGAP
jgi:ribosomal protein L19